MPITQPLVSGKNAIDINDKDFDSLADYEIHLTDNDFCNVAVVVDVDGVSFCNDTATLKFELPCIPIGQYKLEVIDKTTEEVKYTLNSKFYK